MKLLFFLLLPWHTLTWADFKGVPVPDKTIAALSNITIEWTTEDDGEGNNKVSATVFFDPYRSFTRTSLKNVLRHEQGHLDICKIICNKVNHDYAHIRVTDEELAALKSLYTKMWDNIDAQYDLETDGSRNDEAQERWNKWIHEQLKK